MEAGIAGEAEVVGRFLDDVTGTPPDHVGRLIARHARGLGAMEAVVYLASLDQRVLRPLTGDGLPIREPLAIGGTLAGRAYREMSIHQSFGESDNRVWVPLLDGAARLGVMEYVSGLATLDETWLRRFTEVVAQLIVSRDRYGDLFMSIRRDGRVTLAAELQWSLLPPLTCNDGRTTVSGMLEPAHQIAGDSFDYAYNGDTVDVMIMDAVGHGLEAAIVASVGIAAYRNARRDGRDLRGIHAAMNDAVAAHFDDEQFLTAFLGRLDADTGLLESINCGHPAPLHVRRGVVIDPAPSDPALPLGVDHVTAACNYTQLEPGDTLVLFSDGVTEARDPNGIFFGRERLGDFVVKAVNSGVKPAETTRRLVGAILDYQNSRLQDDATVLQLYWHPQPS